MAGFMNQAHLLSTDFDGTLIGFDSDFTCSAEFAEALTGHRRRGGLWAINTGRSLPHILQGLDRFQAPVTPDFLLTNEREIFRRTSDGEWGDYGDWNVLCDSDHQELFHKSAPLLQALSDLVTAHPGAVVVYENGQPSGIAARDEDQAERLSADVRDLTAGVLDFSFQRNTVWLRFCHARYDKGSALGELCRLEGISAANVFCAGDHFNDLSMLRVERAAMLACPANAIAPVKAAVAQSRGHVSDQAFSRGVADGLLHHENRVRQNPVVPAEGCAS